MATTRQPRTTTAKRPVKQTDDYGHLQPQAPELEQAVLGAIMIEKDAYSLVSEILKPDSFYERRHQLLYKAVQSLAVAQKPVDILTVAEQLRSTGELEEVGGPVYITQLAGKCVLLSSIVFISKKRRFRSPTRTTSPRCFCRFCRNLLIVFAVSVCHVVVDEVVFRHEGAGAEDGLAFGREVFPRHGPCVPETPGRPPEAP